MTQQDTKREDGPSEPRLYPHLFRVMHWLLGLSLIVLFVTGLSLYASSSSSWSIFKGVLPPYLLAGRVLLYHLWGVLFFMPAVITMLLILCWLRVGARPAPAILLGSAVVSIITGLMMLNPMGPGSVNMIARGIHDISGLIVLPLAFLWHAAKGFTVSRGNLPATFHPLAHPQLTPLVVFVLVAVVTTCTVLNGLPFSPAANTLVAERIDAVGQDADMTKIDFSKAKPLKIELEGGKHFDAGRTEVTLRAVHDGEELFVLAEWDDPREDAQYMPWEKTEDGWEHLATNPDDENVYYEDKFSLVFPDKSDWLYNSFGCAAHCHLGGGRQYGYKGSNKMVDVWHWKRTRTDPVGQVDDKYWSEVDFEAKDIGRHGDAKQDGGYTKNTSEDHEHPGFLPDDFANCFQGVIPKAHAVEYSEEAAAKIEPGTIVPGMVVAPAVGSRGDITCKAEHKDGRWTVYMRRKLDTGNDDDFKFVPGEKRAFGCAAFDCTSKRHAHNHAVYQLELEP